MSEEFQVNLGLSEEMNLTTEEITALRDEFKADLIEVLVTKGIQDPIIVDDVTIIRGPNSSQQQ